MEMWGPEIIRATLSTTRAFGPGSGEWQYHPRSDHHSKVTAVAVMIDLLRESEELRVGVERGDVGFGVNPVLTDTTNRKKTLDMMFARPDDANPLRRSRSLLDLVDTYGVVLTTAQRKAVVTLPAVYESRVKQALVVLENKACMTAHSKAAPRLRNELEGARDAILASDPLTIAGAFVLVNAASTFVSPTFRDNAERNPSARRATQHHQPADARRAIERLEALPIRRRVDEVGYDVLAIVTLAGANDGSAWRLVAGSDYGSPTSADIWHYTRAVQRLGVLYRQRFT